MPSGNVHYRAYKKMAFFNVPLSILFILIDWRLATISLIAFLFGRWNDNDLDQISITQAEGRAMREIGILGFLWYLVTTTYSYLVRNLAKALKLKNPQHRSGITHSHILWQSLICTSLRISILSVPLIALLWLLGIKLPTTIIYYWFLGQLIGLAPNDWVHSIMDHKEDIRKQKVRAAAKRSRGRARRTSKARSGRSPQDRRTDTRLNTRRER